MLLLFEFYHFAILTFIFRELIPANQPTRERVSVVFIAVLFVGYNLEEEKRMPKSELYIGNLNKNVSQREIESVFKRHGKILRCEIKNKGNKNSDAANAFLSLSF
jgi:hypothetical protein